MSLRKEREERKQQLLSGAQVYFDGATDYCYRCQMSKKMEIQDEEVFCTCAHFSNQNLSKKKKPLFMDSRCQKSSCGQMGVSVTQWENKEPPSALLLRVVFDSVFLFIVRAILIFAVTRLNTLILKYLCILSYLRTKRHKEQHSQVFVLFFALLRRFVLPLDF